MAKQSPAMFGILCLYMPGVKVLQYPDPVNSRVIITVGNINIIFLYVFIITVVVAGSLLCWSNRQASQEFDAALNFPNYG